MEKRERCCSWIFVRDGIRTEMMQEMDEIWSGAEVDNLFLCEEI